MKEYGFQFAVLRYMHDPVTQEFVNIGIVLCSSEARYCKAKIDYSLARISQAFPNATGTRLTQTLQHLESRLAAVERGSQMPTPFLPKKVPLIDILDSILASDDSSLQFGGYGGGLACDLDHELDRLFDRMVMRYVRPRYETT